MKFINNIIVFDNEAELLDYMSEFGELTHIIETKEDIISFVYFVYEGGLRLMVLHHKFDDKYTLSNTSTPRDSSVILRLIQSENAKWLYDVI